LVWRPGIAAAWHGRKAYIERRHALGLKAPGGRPPKRMDRAMAKAVKVLENAMELVPEIARPWNDQDDAERLQTLSRLGMDRARQVLSEPFTPGADLKRDRMMIEAAQGFVRLAVRVDEARYHRQREGDLAGC